MITHISVSSVFMFIYTDWSPIKMFLLYAVYSYQSVSLQWRVGTSSLSSIFATSTGTGMDNVSSTISLLHLL